MAVATQLAGEAGQKPDKRVLDNFGSVLMLGIAYSSSVGGIGTLIGTPTNLVFSGAAPLSAERNQVDRARDRPFHVVGEKRRNDAGIARHSRVIEVAYMLFGDDDGHPRLQPQPVNSARVKKHIIRQPAEMVRERAVSFDTAFRGPQRIPAQGTLRRVVY